jgi:hypothetical protein
MKTVRNRTASLVLIAAACRLTRCKLNQSPTLASQPTQPPQWRFEVFHELDA